MAHCSLSASLRHGVFLLCSESPAKRFRVSPSSLLRRIRLQIFYRNRDGTVDWKKHVTVRLVATGGHQRFVIAQALADYLNSLPGNDVRRGAYKNGTLTVVISDLVIDAMSVTIDLDSTLTNTLDAKLSQALQGKTGTVIGKDANVSYKVTSATTGHYEFQTVSSVIVAMLPKTESKPPATFGLTNIIPVPDFNTWKTTHIDLSKVRRVTAKPLQVQ